MIKTDYAVLTCPGGREVNEDTVLIKEGPFGLFAAVADGLGAHGQGKKASLAAAEKILSCFEKGFCSNQEEIAQAFHRSNQAVAACQGEDGQAMTTLVSLVVRQGTALWGHVGDSRLYHFQNARLVSRTLDHSVPQMAVFMNMITEDQIRFHPDRNRILRALGSDSHEPELSEHVPLSEGFHAFLLCTDGFWEYVPEEWMEETLASSPNPEKWLLKMEQFLKKQTPKELDNYSAAAIFTIGEE